MPAVNNAVAPPNVGHSKKPSDYADVAPHQLKRQTSLGCDVITTAVCQQTRENTQAIFSTPRH